MLNAQNHPEAARGLKRIEPMLAVKALTVLMIALVIVAVVR